LSLIASLFTREIYAARATRSASAR